MRILAEPAALPGAVTARHVNGSLAGMIGGVAIAVAFTELIANTGSALGALDVRLFWVFHMAVSCGLGLLFSFVAEPRGYAASIGTAMAFSLFGVYATLRGLSLALGHGLPAASAIATEAAAHVVYGVVLGATYVYFHRSASRSAVGSGLPDAEAKKDGVGRG